VNATLPVAACPTHLEDDGTRVYSAEPIVTTFDDMEAASEALRVSQRTLYRMLLSGLSWDVADALACRLGVHPVHYWPTWFEDVALDGAEIADQPALPGLRP
jgi:hypothetical protein